MIQKELVSTRCSNNTFHTKEIMKRMGWTNYISFNFFNIQGRYPVASIRDTIRLRFKTNSENGVILYSRGSQGDYIALQLVENRLLLNINLGHVPGKSPMELETSMALGSLLDDNIFHEVLKNIL